MFYQGWHGRHSLTCFSCPVQKTSLPGNGMETSQPCYTTHFLRLENGSFIFLLECLCICVMLELCVRYMCMYVYIHSICVLCVENCIIYLCVLSVVYVNMLYVYMCVWCVTWVLCVYVHVLCVHELCMCIHVLCVHMLCVYVSIHLCVPVLKCADLAIFTSSINCLHLLGRNQESVCVNESPFFSSHKQSSLRDDVISSLLFCVCSSTRLMQFS